MIIDPGSSRPQRVRYLFFGIALGLAIAAAAGALLVAPLALTHRDASSLETAYGNAMVSLVARVGGTGVGPNPLTLPAKTLQAARAAYTGSCSQCHGAAGDGRGAFGQTAFPHATDLTGESTRELSDEQIFYIVKNGLGYTPMPAYGGQYSDLELWGLVNFIRSLQDGKAPHLAVFPPTNQQRRAANLQPGGDARRGAEIFAALACGACHQPSGGLTIDAADRNVANAVRDGRPGMPCYTEQAISTAELQDLLAYIATFPAGELGQDPSPPPPRNPQTPCG